MGRALIAVILLIVGLAAVAAGIVYFTMSAHALPSFFPGHISHVTSAKRTKHGIAAVVVGAVLLILSGAVMVGGRRRY